MDIHKARNLLKELEGKYKGILPEKSQGVRIAEGLLIFAKYDSGLKCTFRNEYLYLTSSSFEELTEEMTEEDIRMVRELRWVEDVFKEKPTSGDLPSKERHYWTHY